MSSTEHFTTDDLADIFHPRTPVKPRRGHTSSPVRMEHIEMAGVPVWHHAGYQMPGTPYWVEPTTRYLDVYSIIGGIVEPIRVRKWIATPRMRTSDRHTVGSWVDVTHTIADTTTHETVVRCLAIREGASVEAEAAA